MQIPYYWKQFHAGNRMHNQLFEKFYDGDDDKVRGLIAYGLYKIAKREWFTEFQNVNDRAPKSGEIIAYTATWTQALLDGKRSEANTIMEAYSNTVIENVTPEIVERALRGTWPDTLLKNIASAAIYTAVLILIAFILKWSGVDLNQVAESVQTSSLKPPS